VCFRFGTSLCFIMPLGVLLVMKSLKDQLRLSHFFEIITYCVSALSLHMKFTDSMIASMICVKSCSIWTPSKYYMSNGKTFQLYSPGLDQQPNWESEIPWSHLPSTGPLEQYFSCSFIDSMTSPMTGLLRAWAMASHVGLTLVVNHILITSLSWSQGS